MTTTTGTTTIGNHWDEARVPAANYERGLVPVLFQPWAHDLVELADPRSGERVLDVACGTGIVTRIAAPRVAPSGTVTGLDVNPDMLAVARQVGTAIRPAISWRQASAADTGLPDAAFDVVFCQQGLQFFRDRPAAAREIHRVMAPGGRLAVSVWCDGDNPGYTPFAVALQRHLPSIPEAVGFIRAIFSLDDADELHELLATAGFEDVHISRHTKTVRLSSAQAWVEAFLGAAPIPGIATLEASARDRITQEVVEALRPRVDGRGLVFSIDAHVALARRS